MNAATLINSVTVEQLTEHLQQAGYRVNRTEHNGAVQLLSASQGIGFALRMGNPASESGHYLDYTYSCALRIQGGLPAGLTEQWNTSRRFARLSQQGEFLLMEMDAIVAAGVSAEHQRSLSELWDRLLQEFIVYLREYVQQGASASPVAEPSQPNAVPETQLAEPADSALSEA